MNPPSRRGMSVDTRRHPRHAPRRTAVRGAEPTHRTTRPIEHHPPGPLGSLVSTGTARSPFERDPAFIERIFPLVKAINLYFAVEVRGWKHVPRTPCLIVGNHSGGSESTDFWFLLHKWVRERGAAAPLYGLAYDLLFSVPSFATALRRVGIIPASRANAHAAFELGSAVSVFPGGDYEVFRPWRERNRIDFCRHTGFISLAIAERVPVVPMTIHGAHQSTLVLTRGQQLAHAVGLDRLHVKVFPFLWNIPFGPAPAFVPSIHLPAKVTVQCGPPLDWSRYRRTQAHDPTVLRACYGEITEVMQRTLDRLAREDPHPVVARVRELSLGGVIAGLREIFTDAPGSRRPRVRAGLAA